MPLVIVSCRPFHGRSDSVYVEARLTQPMAEPPTLTVRKKDGSNNDRKWGIFRRFLVPIIAISQIMILPSLYRRQHSEVWKTVVGDLPSTLSQTLSIASDTLYSRPRVPLTEKAIQCIEKSPFYINTTWEPFPNNELCWDAMSTVQLKTIVPVGFPSRCDWVIGSRMVQWGVLPASTAWGGMKYAPRSIFVHAGRLRQFYEELWPCLSDLMPTEYATILLIGDHDATTPLQTDERFPSPILKKEQWNKLIFHEKQRIAHIFVEHLDEATDPARVTPIPVGFNPKEYNLNLTGLLERAFVPAPVSDIRQRNLTVLFSNRIYFRKRFRGQFLERQRVKTMCEKKKLNTCVVLPPKTYSGEEFLTEMKKHTFQFCIHGGGIEPNPCVFTAVMKGVIPVVAEWPGQIVYEGLPVYFVPNTTESVLQEYLSVEALQKVLGRLAPQFEDKALRHESWLRMQSQYWWNKVLAVPAPK